MNTDQPRALRKHLITESLAGPADPAAENELDLHACATVHFSSEQPEHPVEHLFDHSSGRGATRWVGARRDKPETILLVFDEPKDISHCAFEAEEREVMRTQEVSAEYLTEGGTTYRQSFVQEFNFSPEGATYQKELFTLDLRRVTRFRITVMPNKSGRGAASLTTLRLFGR